MADRDCPRCHGRMREEAQADRSRDLVCVTCGHREPGPAREERARAAAPADPFDQIVEAMGHALNAIKGRLQRLEAERPKRMDQVRRLEKALNVLTGTNPRAAGNFFCGKCGNHTASRAHREACKAAAA